MLVDSEESLPSACFILLKETLIPLETIKVSFQSCASESVNETQISNGDKKHLDASSWAASKQYLPLMLT